MSEHPKHVEDPGAITAPEDDPLVPPTVVVGVIGILATVLIILALDALHHRTEQAHFERKSDAPYRALHSIEAAQRDVLEGYRWVDRENGVVSIPIERAMQLVVAESDDGSGR